MSPRLALKAAVRWLRAPANAAGEPRWKVAILTVVALPLVPLGRRVFLDLTRGGWAP